MLLLLLLLLLPPPAQPQLSCELTDDAEFNTQLQRSADAGRPCRLARAGAQGQKFKILSGGRRFADYFSVADGTLVTSQRVDRERLCDAARVCCNASQRVCGASLKVTVTGAGDSIDIVTVHVRVIDRNDHAPSFPLRLFELPIFETSERNSEFSLPAAVDKDSRDFSIERYELQPHSDAFKIVQQQAASGQMQVKLRQLGLLDREARSNYTFVLTAHDRGRPSLSGSMSVRVKVLDANDHSPVFEQQSYSGVVNETERVGHRLLCVAASDADEESNALLTYELSPMTERGVRRDFRLDSATGCVTVRSPLNFERRSAYSFTVVAKDRSANPRSAEVPVHIRVKDVNDCDPKISVDFISSSITESRDPVVRKPIAVVSVQDDDLGPAGQVACRVVPPDAGQPAKFQLEPISGDDKSFKLLLNGSVDREAAAYEQLRVCCSDAGSPPRTDCAELRVKVLDINDQPPRFVRPQRRVRLHENLPIGTRVAAMRATDADEEPNNSVVYSIDAHSARHFSVNSRTGDVATAEEFDRELRETYAIVVTATDPGGLSASTTVTVSIQDVNDEKPRVVEPHSGDSFEFEVREGSAGGTLVGRLRAEDADSGEFGRLRYSLLPSREFGSFHISGDSGRITTKRKLDREHRAQYQLLVLIVDNPAGSRRHSTTVSVLVRVLDVNDNKPSIQFPTAHNTTFGVSYQEPAGQLILQVRASDSDSGENGLLHFELLSAPGRDPSLFFIDASDGKVKVNRDMSERDVGEHPLTVVASDSGQPRLSSSTSIVVIIDKSAPRQLLPDGRRGRRPRPASSLTVLLVATACAMVLLLLLLTLYVCHRRGLFGDAGLVDICVGSDAGAGVGRSAAAWKGGSRPADTHESLAFLAAQRTTAADRRDKPFPSVTSSLNHSEDTAVSFEDQYTSCSQRRTMRRDGTQRTTPKAVAQPVCSDYCSAAAAAAVGGHYEEAGQPWPPAYYDLELHGVGGGGGGVGGVGGDLKATRQQSSSIDNLAAVSRQPQTVGVSPPRTGHLGRRRPPEPGACVYDLHDLLEQGAAGQTLRHLGKLYSIPKASYV